MKKAADKFVRIFAAVLAVLSVSILLFTLVSTLFLNRTDKEWFGYKAFIVLSDSMSVTDFSAGDLVFVRHVDPSTLQPGDIIAFTSRNDSNYGDTVTHKIRALTTTADGAPGFTTYGTTTDTDDEAVVPYSDVIGRYAGHLPKVGLFFNFLKTTPGYLLCIFLPFALLILSQAVQTVRLFRAYRREQAGAGDSDAFALPEPQSGAEIAARLAAGEDVTLQADTAFTDADGHCIDCVIAPRQGRRPALERPPPERHDTAGRRCGPDSTWQRHDTGYRPQPQPRRLPHLRPRAGLPRGPVRRPLSGRCRILCRLCGGGAGGFARRPVRRKGRQRRPPAVQRRGWGHHRRGRAVCRV